MPENTFVQAEPAASLADIEAIEQEYGFTLPEEYKVHILAVNGGYPRLDRFQIPSEDNHWVTVNNFYSVANGDDTLQNALEDLRDQLHDDLVPFANEAGGDQFVLSVGPEDYGSVYYIAHESYVPPEYDYDEETNISTPPPPRQYGEGVYFLASSFTAFMAGLVAGSPVED